MFTLSENTRATIHGNKHQAIVNEIFVNGWNSNEQLLVVGVGPFDMEEYRKYLPEDLEAKIKIGDDIETTGKKLLEMAEKLEGPFPVVYSGRHRGASLISLSLTGSKIKGKMKEVKDVETALSLDFESNRQNELAMKLEYADKFKEAQAGIESGKYQREGDLKKIFPNPTGQRNNIQKAWLGARLMDEYGVPFEYAVKIPSYKKGQIVEQELANLDQKAKDYSVKMEEVFEGATAKVNATKVMPGSEIKEAQALAEAKGSTIINEILKVIIANEPNSLRKLINASATIEEAVETEKSA